MIIENLAKRRQRANNPLPNGEGDVSGFHDVTHDVSLTTSIWRRTSHVLTVVSSKPGFVLSVVRLLKGPKVHSCQEGECLPMVVMRGICLFVCLLVCLFVCLLLSDPATR